MTKLKIMVTVVLVGFISSLYFSITNASYLEQAPPGMKPEIFAPGIISLPGRFERTPNFSPDDKEFYFTVIQPDFSRQQIYYTKYNEQMQWSSPQEIFFSVNRTSAADVSLSSDGRKLCFSSNLGNSDFWNNDIWICERVGNWWSEPVKLSTRINTSSGEWGPCILNNSTIYFARSLSGTNSDIYCSKFVDGQYEVAYNIRAVNTIYNEWDSFVSEDESYMIFKSNRPGGYGSLDLYISHKDINDGSWREPINLGPAINTSIHDDCGNVTPDGKYFMFARRNGDIEMDIYWVDIHAILPDPNGPIQNLVSAQRFSSIQCAINYADDGDTIVINPGIYRESIILSGKTVVLQSIDPNESFYIGGTIIQGYTDGPVVSLEEDSSNCTIAGLTIRAGSIGIKSSAANTTIRNCRIMDNVTNGLELSQGSSPHLQNCLITGNDQTGMTMLAGSRRKICKPVIENCFVVDNGQADIVGGEPVIVNSIISDN